MAPTTEEPKTEQAYRVKIVWLYYEDWIIAVLCGHSPVHICTTTFH